MALNTVVPVVMGKGLIPGAPGTVSYTVPVAKTAVVKDIWFANTDTVAHAITWRVVPSGQATSDAWCIFRIMQLAPAGQPGANFQAGASMNMLAGDFIDVFADVASKVTCRISGVEVS
jgi:hypothetical protein